MDILLIRHGQPQEGGSDSPNDPPLTLAGRRQAFGTAQMLAEEGVTRIVASPLRRAQETAAPLAALSGLSIETAEDWAEIDRDHDGPYRSVEILRSEGAEVWAAFCRDPFAFFGVDPLAFRERVIAALGRELSAAPGDARVAVVAHGMPIKICVSHVLKLPELSGLAIGYSSVTRLQYLANGDLKILSLNETSHLNRST